MEVLLFTIVSKKIKYLWINISERLQNEKDKQLKKKIEKGLENGKKSHAQGLVELTLFKGQFCHRFMKYQ